MACRLCIAIGIIGIALVFAAPVAAQPNSTLRTPHGDPDIQGVFTFRTITPFERPEALGEKTTLTEEEAAVFELSLIHI